MHAYRSFIVSAGLLCNVACGGNAVDLGHTDGWTDLPATEVKSAEPQTVFRSQEQVIAFTVDDTTLYALVTRGNSYNYAPSFELISCPIEACGSERKTLHQGPLLSYVPSPMSLTLVDGWLFWVLSEQGVASCPVQGCQELELTRADTHALGSDEQSVYWIEAQAALKRLEPGTQQVDVVRSFSALDNLYVEGLAAEGAYVHFRGGDTLYRIPKDGSSDPEEFVTDEDLADFSVSEDQLYYSSNSLAGRIARCDVKDCGAGAATLVDQQRWPSDLCIEDGEMFWVKERRPGTIREGMSLTSCGLPECDTLKSWPVDFTADDSSPFVRPSADFVLNRKYILWVSGLPTTGSVLKVVER